MVRLLSRLGGALLSLALVGSPASAQTRPIQVDDIVALEAFGRASIDPSGRWAVYEKRGPYDTAPRFDFAQRSVWAIWDLWRVDLTRPERPPERLLPGEGIGLLRGDWSPSGGRMIVQRFQDGRFEFGIADVAARAVRWTGLTPEIAPTGATAAWVSDEAAVLMVRPDGSLPGLLRFYSDSQARMTQAWADTRSGQRPARTVLDAEAGVARARTPTPDQALVRVDTRTGAQRTLLRGRIADVAVAPGGRHLAVLVGGEPMPIRERDIDQQDPPARQRLVFVDLETGAVARPMPDRDVAPHLLRWSPDGRAVLVWARPDGATWTAGDLMRVSPDGGRAIDRGGLSPGSADDILHGVRADWMGDAVLLQARRSADGRRDWHRLADGKDPQVLTAAISAPPGRLAAVEDEAVRLFADGAMWRLDAGGATRLTPSGTRLTEVAIGDPEAPLRLKAAAPARAWTWAVDAAGDPVILDAAGGMFPLDPGGLEPTRVLAATPGAALVLDRSGLVETLSLRTANTSHRLDAVNAGLAGVVLPTPRPIPHRDAAGRETTSWLFLPPDRPADAVRGVIVEVYPGSVDAGTWSGPLTLTYGYRAAVLAGAGYAVLTPAMPIDHPESATAPWYAASVDLALDAALAAEPGLPGDRTAVLGHSFGGHAALAIATVSRRHRSYVAAAGMSDWIGHWGEFIAPTRILPEDGFMLMTQQGYVESGQGGLGAPPWAGLQAYGARSPYLAADRITAPVLLITADKDFVPMSQSERMFSALYRRGGRARLITYWGEHHQMWSPANIRDVHAQIFAWLDETLAPEATVTPDPDAAPRPEASLRTPP
jgi:dipeptidyl aminopeptidase/acylaminoacyl peptidase